MDQATVWLSLIPRGFDLDIIFTSTVRFGMPLCDWPRELHVVLVSSIKTVRQNVSSDQGFVSPTISL